MASFEKRAGGYLDCIIYVGPARPFNTPGYEVGFGGSFLQVSYNLPPKPLF